MAGADEFKGQLLSTLDATETNAKHGRLFELMARFSDMRRQKASQALTQIGRDCVATLFESFTRREHNAITRRWIGLTLHQVIEGCPATVHILTQDNHDLSLIGSTILTQCEDLKLVAGMVMKAMMMANVPVERLWPKDTRASQLADDFPKSDSLKWIENFADFADVLTEADLLSQTTAGMHYAVYMLADDWVPLTPDAGTFFVLIEGDRILLIRPASAEQLVRYLEIPIGRIVKSTVKKSQLRTVAGDDASQMVDELLLEFDNGSQTYLLDAREQDASIITVAFSDNEEAENARTHIEELRGRLLQRSSQSKRDYVKMSSSQAIDISKPPRTSSLSQRTRPQAAQSLTSRESQAGSVTKQPQIDSTQARTVTAVIGVKDTHRPPRQSVSTATTEEGNAIQIEEDASNHDDLYDVSPKVRISQQTVKGESQAQTNHSTKDNSNPQRLVRDSQEGGSDAETEIVLGRQGSQGTTKHFSAEAALLKVGKKSNSPAKDSGSTTPPQQESVPSKSQPIRGGSSAALALARERRGKENIPPDTTEHTGDALVKVDQPEPVNRNENGVIDKVDRAAKNQTSVDSQRTKGVTGSIAVQKAAKGPTKSSTKPKDKPDRADRGAGKLKSVKRNLVKDDSRIYEVPAELDEEDDSSISDYAPSAKNQRKAKAPTRKSESAKKSQAKKPSGREKARKSTTTKPTQGRNKGRAVSAQPKAQPKVISSLKQKGEKQPLSAAPQASQMTVKESLARKRRSGSIAPSQKPDEGEIDNRTSKRQRTVNEADVTAFEKAFNDRWQLAGDAAYQDIDETIPPAPRSDASIRPFEAAVLDMAEGTLPTDLPRRQSSHGVLPIIEKEENHRPATKTITAPTASHRPSVGGIKAMSRLSLALGGGDPPDKSKSTNDDKKRKAPEEGVVVDESLARKPTLINFGPKGPLNQGWSSVHKVRRTSHNAGLAEVATVSEGIYTTLQEAKAAERRNEKGMTAGIGTIDMPQAFQTGSREQRLVGEDVDDDGLPDTQAGSFSDNVPVAPIKHFPSSGPILPKPAESFNMAAGSTEQEPVLQEAAAAPQPSDTDHPLLQQPSLFGQPRVSTVPIAAQRLRSVAISLEGSPVLLNADEPKQLEDGSATDQFDMEDSTLLPPHVTTAQYASQPMPQRIFPLAAPRGNVVSSNSKPKPSSPTADSRAITGHETQEQIERTLSSARKPDDPFIEAPTSMLARTKVTPLTAIMRRHFEPDVVGEAEAAGQNTDTKNPAAKHVAMEDDPDKTLVEEGQSAALPPKKRQSEPKQQIIEISSADESDSSSEATAMDTEPEANTEHNEQMEWEASLASHQKTVLDALLQISRRLVRHLVSHETAISDVVEDYLKSGQTLIGDLENAYKQQSDAGREVLEHRRAKHANTFRSIGRALHDEKESRKKQGEKIRRALRERDRENRRGVEGVKAMLKDLETV